MITTRAPGKLYIAGEYAVVEPGEPAVLVAVDRYVTVRCSEAHGEGSIASDQYGRQPIVWHRKNGKLEIAREHRPFDYVLAAVSVMEQLVGELGLSHRFYHLRIESELDDISGRKFGLGSSAAVTVATVTVLDRFYGLGLSREELFRLSLLATIDVAPLASGGDVAASMFGGWIYYRSPDRTWLLDQRRDRGVLLTMRQAWPHHEIRHLREPRSAALVVGWTGVPASTERLVDDARERRNVKGSHYPEFLDASHDCVSALASALDRGDEAAAMRAIRGARAALAALAANAGLEIETERLTQLVVAAERVGAAAKSSGAGGGDCGIVLAPSDIDLAPMFDAWERHEVRHLALGVHPASIDGHTAPITMQRRSKHGRDAAVATGVPTGGIPITRDPSGGQR